MKGVISVLLTTAAAPAFAQSQIPPTPVEISVIKENGAYRLRTTEGTLPIYTFDRDAPDKSNCVAQCAQAWPPVAAPPGSRPVGEWRPIARADGSAQWAFRGKPVYVYAKDADRTDRNALGDGLGGVWHVLAAIPGAPISAAGGAGVAPTAPASVRIERGSDGQGFFSNLHGYALYSFDRDAGGKSLCSGDCAIAWPPLTAAEGSAPVGDWTIFQRTDGRLQWAYKGRPAYSRSGDQPDGGHGGDGVRGEWHLLTW